MIRGVSMREYIYVTGKWGGGLTGEASPARHVAGSLVRQDEARGGEAGRLHHIG